MCQQTVCFVPAAEEACRALHVQGRTLSSSAATTLGSWCLQPVLELCSPGGSRPGSSCLLLVLESMDASGIMPEGRDRMLHRISRAAPCAPPGLVGWALGACCQCLIAARREAAGQDPAACCWCWSLWMQPAS